MFLKNFLLAFIPIFVAVDAIGVLPLFISFTGTMPQKNKSKIIRQSVITALLVSTGFIFIGKAIFKILGITMGDFMIAGGTILFCIALVDMINPLKKRRYPANDLGIVPLGMPLIVGPAVLTTSMMLVGEYGVYTTLLSIICNVILAGIIFSFSGFLIKPIGISGAKALSKIASLLLAAIAVHMIRKGVMQIIMK